MIRNKVYKYIVLYILLFTCYSCSSSGEVVVSDVPISIETPEIKGVITSVRFSSSESDTLRSPLRDAKVVLRDSLNYDLVTTQTDFDGRFLLTSNELEDGTSYLIEIESAVTDLIPIVYKSDVKGEIVIEIGSDGVLSVRDRRSESGRVIRGRVPRID